jgi:hypothetical protein
MVSESLLGHCGCFCFSSTSKTILLPSRKKSGKLKTAFKRDFVNVGCDIDFEGPIVHAAAVLGYEGWLAGYQMAFDTAKSKLTQNNFALAHIAGDFQLHTNVWVFTRNANQCPSHISMGTVGIFV